MLHPPSRALRCGLSWLAGAAALLSARRESVGAGGDALTTGTLPFAPKGSRTLWNVSLGVVIGQ